MKEIIVKSRYRDVVIKLCPISDSVYEVHTNSMYTRIGYRNDNSIEFIDFEGGPFISIGSNIEGNIVKNITKGDNYLIEFENGSISGKND
ncbi:hypothetical protein [Intestinibacter sp.]|uniref:hypothetical protein n=1 Tax=Intestinibacter sp. TaxID=1965304 RepID=UPI003F144A14